MKNIHLLPTKSKTRLFLSNYGKILNLASYPETFYTTGQNIYITNSEEIKEGDYVCASGGFRFVKTLNNDARTFKDDGIVSKESPSNSCHLSNYKKIILTTDQDLINDGVQAIDDEFLEWFVKNPSCEEIDYWKYMSGEYSTMTKEEQTKCYCGHTTTCDCGPEEPKQETLEEAAKEFANNSAITNYEEGINVGKYQGFINGAKWQMERSYSEEEVEDIVQKLMYDVHCGNICEGDWLIDFKISPRQWFEQFKKK